MNDNTYLTYMSLLPNPVPQEDVDNQDLAQDLHKAGGSFLTQWSGRPLLVDCEAFILLSQTSHSIPQGSGQGSMTKQETCLSECPGGILGNTLGLFKD